MILLCLVGFLPLPGQVNVSGSLQSWLYSFENLEENQELDYFQALQFRLTPDRYRNLYLTSYLRVAKRGDNDWEDRLYNLYGDWKSPSGAVEMRLGRQFTYAGVVNGTLDGLAATVRPLNGMKVRLFGGLESPFDRSFELRDTDDGQSLGAYIEYRFPRSISSAVSYVRKERQSGVVWHQAGLTLNGKVGPDLYYQTQLDHNLETEQLQTVRGRLSYYRGPWAVSGEYSTQKPRVYEDSYFRIFRLTAFNQARTGINYTFRGYQFGIQYIFTDFEIEENHQLIGALANSWGIIGLLYQGGYGIENAGIYGELYYGVRADLELHLYGDFNQYQRHAVEISEDATAFSGGVTYTPVPSLAVSAELQESINSGYDNDTRGLFRLLYRFAR